MKYNRRQFIKTSALATSGIIFGCSVKDQFDIIIKNCVIIDGTGSSPYKGELGIKGDRITAIDKDLGNSD